MSLGRSVYKRIERLLPNFYKSRIMQQMIYAGIKLDYKEWVGFFFLYSIGLAVTAAIITGLFFSTEWYVITGVAVFVFLLVNGSSELLLTLGIRSRTIFIEKILPDVISLLASNIRSGVTIDQALLLSTRDEFGSFKEDLIKASKETLIGWMGQR